MIQVFLGMVIETDNLTELKRWAKDKSLEPPIVRPLTTGTPARTGQRDNIELNAAAFRVFEYWKTQCRHPRAVPGDRIRKVKSRLRERMALHNGDLAAAEADLQQAIDGAARAATVNETTGKRYDDLELICRNASKLEDFMGRATGSAGDQRQALARRFG